MDKISELLEQMATISIEMNQAINKVKDDIDRFALLTKANALDYEIHGIRQYLEGLGRPSDTDKET